MHFPGVICVKLPVAPAAFRDFRCLDLGVIQEHCVADEQVGNTVTGLLAAALNRSSLVTATSAAARLVFEVVTKQAAELPLVRSLNEREVVFPDIEVFTIGPGSLVPDVGVTTCTPEKRRDSAADGAVRVRKHCGDPGSDLILQRLRYRCSSDDDVVTRDRKLKFVDGLRRN